MENREWTRRQIVATAVTLVTTPFVPGIVRTQPMKNVNKIKGVGQIALTVSDIAKAKAFYCDVLGLEHLFDAGPNLSFINAGNLRLMLTLPESGLQAGRNSVVYYRVESVEEAHKEAVAKGAKAAGEPHMIAQMDDHELWMGFLQDPEGNLLGLMEERRRDDSPAKSLSD